MQTAHKYPEIRLTFDAVGFERGDKTLFDNLSFELSSSQIIWVQGENGIGKTSILRLALGLWAPSEGKISITANDDLTVANYTMGYVGHNDAFEGLLSAYESLEFWAKLYEYDLPLKPVFEQVGLLTQMNVRTEALSAGQKRRLAFARLIIAERPLWVMDEPKAALDAAGRELFDNMLTNHLKRGGAALVATHNMATPLGTNARSLILEAA